MEQHSIIIYILFAIVMILTMPTPWQGVIVLLAGIIAAWFRLGLFTVAAICCVIAYLSVI